MVFSLLELERIFCVEQRVEDKKKKWFMTCKYMWNTWHPSICSSLLQFYSLLFPMHLSGFEDVDDDFGGKGLALAQQSVACCLSAATCAEGVWWIVLTLKIRPCLRDWLGWGPLSVLSEEKEQTSHNVMLHLLLLWHSVFQMQLYRDVISGIYCLHLQFWSDLYTGVYE